MRIMNNKKLGILCGIGAKFDFVKVASMVHAFNQRKNPILAALLDRKVVEWINTVLLQWKSIRGFGAVPIKSF